MKQKRLLTGAVSIALAVTMMSTTAFAAKAEFTDVPSNHWAVSSISEMANKGIMSGVGNNLFAPSSTLTGAEFVTMIVRHFYGDKLGAGGEKWYSEFMAVAEKEGILASTSITAEGVINRYDMAQLMYNVLKAEGISTTSLSDTSKVADWSSVPSSYQDAVSVCYNMGMLTGVDSKGTFNGNGKMDRAQAAVVMDRLIEVCGGSSTPEVPAGAVQITSKNQLTTAMGIVEDTKGFHIDPNSVMNGAAHLGISCEGYSAATLTVTAGEKDMRIIANVQLIGHSAWEPADMRGEEIIKAGETRTITFDCSGGLSFGFTVERADAPGNFAEGWITNLYLS